MFYHWTGTRRILWWRNAVLPPCEFSGKVNHVSLYEGWNFNSGNYLFTTDTKFLKVNRGDVAA